MPQFTLEYANGDKEEFDAFYYEVGNGVVEFKDYDNCEFLVVPLEQVATIRIEYPDPEAE